MRFVERFVRFGVYRVHRCALLTGVRVSYFHVYLNIASMELQWRSSLCYVPLRAIWPRSYIGSFGRSDDVFQIDLRTTDATFICMCICACACVFVLISVCVYVDVPVYVYVCVYVHVYAYAHAYAYVYVEVDVDVDVGVDIDADVYEHAHVH